MVNACERGPYVSLSVSVYFVFIFVLVVSFIYLLCCVHFVSGQLSKYLSCVLLLPSSFSQIEQFLLLFLLIVTISMFIDSNWLCWYVYEYGRYRLWMFCDQQPTNCFGSKQQIQNRMEYAYSRNLNRIDIFITVDFFFNFVTQFSVEIIASMTKVANLIAFQSFFIAKYYFCSSCATNFTKYRNCEIVLMISKKNNHILRIFCLSQP